MKYYKIIQDQKIIGVNDSFGFRYINSINNMILSTGITKANFLEYKNTLYHDSWMKTIPNTFKRFQMAIIKEINEEDYLNLLSALQTNEVIIKDNNNPEPLIPIVQPEEIDITGIELIKSAKIKELSQICNQTIESGVDVGMLDGQTHHFSLTTQDQLNLISLQAMIDQGMEQIPYHADGELCKFYTPVEIKMIISEATKWKTYHTTYYNALKNYVNSLDDPYVIANITYGIELPEEYQSDVLKALNA